MKEQNFRDIIIMLVLLLALVVTVIVGMIKDEQRKLKQFSICVREAKLPSECQ